MFYGSRLGKIEERLRKIENFLGAFGQNDERRQNEWRETREQIVAQMEEIRRILRPDEPR